MITITRPAKPLDFCGNGLPFKIQTNKAYIAYNQNAELVISIDNVLQTGNILTFSFGGKTINFTTYNPTVIKDDGVTLHDGNNTPAIADVLQHNYLLSKYYNISFIGNQITFNAKLPGASYTLDFLCNTTNVNQYHFIPGMANSLRPGYKTLCEIYLEKNRGSNKFDLIATSFLNLDKNSTSVVYPGKLISKYFNTVDLPDINQAALKLIEKPLKNYYLQFADYYDSEAHLLTKSNILKAIDGQINDNLFSNSFNLQDFINTEKSYLLAPEVNSFETYPDAQQFLYFVCCRTTANLQQKVKLYYTDGIDSVQNIGAVVPAYRYDCFVVPAGCNQLSLANFNLLKTIYKYEIYIEYEGGLIGKKITYTLVNKPVNSREFWFKNNMGGFESLICEKQIHTVEIKKTQILTEKSYNTSLDLINDVYECFTGNKTAAQIEHLFEFVKSENVYLLQNNTLVKVCLEDGNYNLINEDEDLYSFKFKYRIVSDKKILIVDDNPVIITDHFGFSDKFSHAFS